MRNITLTAMIAFALGWAACYHLSSLVLPKPSEAAIYVTDKPVDIGKRLHFRGRTWIVTKVVVQNAETWVEENRKYYRENPGPRYDSAGKISLEGPSGDYEGKIQYGIFGVVVD